MYRMPRLLCLVTLLVALVATGCGTSLTTGTSGAETTKVLLVGNSYTYFNDMPEMIEEIAAANGARIETTTVASGGYFLDDHVASGDAQAALASGDFDIVVLQEQSMAPAGGRELRQRTIPAAMTLDAYADDAGARVVLYQTWGRQNGAPNLGLNNFDAMQRALVDGYEQVADSTRAEVARVGESWQRIIRSGAGLQLFADDGSHPSAAGSYAAAMELVETILVTEIVTAPAVDDVDEEIAAAIAVFG